MGKKTALGYVLDDDGTLIDAFIQCDTTAAPQPTAVEKEIVRIVKEHREIRSEMLKNGYNQTWHVCRDDKVRPYPAVLCSSCFPSKPRREFDPLDELKTKTEALEWIAGACDVPGKCTCGRPNGIPAIKVHAEQAMKATAANERGLINNN